MTPRPCCFCLALHAFAQSGTPSLQEQAKSLEQKIEDQGIYVETAQPGVQISGYVDAGYTYNFIGSRAATLANSPSRGDFQLFDTSLTFEKALPEEAHDYAAGFRINLHFGEDYFGTQTGEIEINEAFATFCVPVGNGLVFTVGKWEGLIGYEATGRLYNPNITYSLMGALFEPGTHTGLLLSYVFNDIVEVNFGIANGWNNDNGGFAGLEINKDSVDPYLITGSVAVNAPGGQRDDLHRVCL